MTEGNYFSISPVNVLLGSVMVASWACTWPSTEGHNVRALRQPVILLQRKKSLDCE